MNHLRACEYCPRYGEIEEVACDGEVYKIPGCTIYSNATLDWVNRIGGCPMFPLRDLPPHYGMEYLDGKIVRGSHRPGQQKQKKADRKYENRRSRSKYGGRTI